MTNTLLIDPFSGASGDMLLAALVDAGCPLDSLREQLLGIPALSGVAVDVENAQSGVFAAKRLKIALPHEHAHRGLADVSRIIGEAQTISARVKERAIDTFTRLARAEARVHGIDTEKVHFHEVGALDAILDITGFYAAAELMGLEQFYYTRLVVGSGQTGSEHGRIPVPAPATLELLSGHSMEFSDRREELLTPTAAAIIATCFERLPGGTGFTAGVTGYGAGTRKAGEGELPNILRVATGRLDSKPRQVSIVRTTIDDMNPEFYGYVMERIFGEGALEVYHHPVMMKKNRPGTEVTVICETVDEQRLAGLLMVHTTTLGVRITREDRLELERRQETVQTEIGEARIKIGILPDGSQKMSPEYESCKSLSADTGVPIAAVFDIVRRAWRGDSSGGNENGSE
jgi:uncharacterized protein (TIGR00299 family) protein